MRLPFLSPKPKAKAPRDPSTEEEKKTQSPRAQRKAAAKKRAWDAEQERRRLAALARWESALEAEPAGTASLPLPQPRLVVSADVGAASVPQLIAPGPVDERHVTSAQGRLERRGKQHHHHHSQKKKTKQHRRSRRFLDIDHLDELSELSTSDDESVVSAAAPNMAMVFPPALPIVRARTTGPGSSPAAQLYQVAAMRELPGLQGCATRQAPSSFFVDMFLLDEASTSDTSLTDEDKAAKALREAHHRSSSSAKTPRSSTTQPSRRQ